MQKHIKNMSAQLIYAVLLLYYAYLNPETPRWAKSTIIGAMGYLISPLDSIPDLTPFIGFTDDMGVVMFSLVTIACYIDKQVRESAKAKIGNWIPKLKLETLKSVDQHL